MDEHHIDENTEDNDGRALFSPKSKWTPENIKDQRKEAVYVVALLIFSLILLSVFGLMELSVERNGCATFFGIQLPSESIKYGFLSASGLLGGTVYGAKWLYHAVARGLWHEDRGLWRYMQPWISLGTTIGIWALIDSGYFKGTLENMSMMSIGFVIGYLSDQFLAKMKEITNVLFGKAERHFEKAPEKD